MRRPRIPAGLLGMIPLILAVECALEAGGDRNRTPDQAIFVRTVDNADRLAPGRDVLVFGDSLAKLGVAPRRIEAETGLRGYNLAMSGSQASNSYYMLKRALDAGARPKFVVVDFFPPLQRLPIEHVIENDPFQLRWLEAAELAVETGNPTFLASMTARLLLPSVRRRVAIRTTTFARIKKTFERRWPAFIRPLIANHEANDGAQIHPAKPPDESLVPKLDADCFPRWEVLPVQETYMRRFFDLARAHGATVVWILPPYMPELQARTARSGFDGAWTEFIDGWARATPNLRIFDAREADYPVIAFLDPNHLSKPGAAVFSRDLGRALASGGNERWIKAPKHRPDTEADRLVDIDQSGERLRRLAASSGRTAR